MEPSKDNTDILYLLSARALQRKGKGFPSTQEEIDTFKATCKTTEEEKKEFEKKLGSFIENAYKAVTEKTNPKCITIYDRLPNISGDQVILDAARKAKGENLSHELEQEIQEIIEKEESGDDKK